MDAIASATSPNPNRIACGVVKFYKVGTELTYEPRNESFFISIKRFYKEKPFLSIMIFSGITTAFIKLLLRLF